jgi:hypothetical protein
VWKVPAPRTGNGVYPPSYALSCNLSRKLVPSFNSSSNQYFNHSCVSTTLFISSWNHTKLASCCNMEVTVNKSKINNRSASSPSVDRFQDRKFITTTVCDCVSDWCPMVIRLYLSGSNGPHMDIHWKILYVVITILKWSVYLRKCWQ